MNKERRKELLAIINRLQSINLSDESEVDSVKYDLESVLCDEEGYMDNIPENLQGSYRYEKAEEACDNLQCAIDVLENDDIDINDVTAYIYNALI